MRYSIGIATDAGPKPRNEDSVLAVVPEKRPSAILLMVADGMGGANAGHLASQQAIEVVRSIVIDQGIPEADDASMRLRSAIESANRTIYERGKSSPELEGMGCTVVAALILDDTFWVAHVGDSRAYLVRGGASVQLTQDHTWVSAQVRDGKMTEQQAADLKLGHVLDRALGPDSTVQVDLWADDILEEGDVLVLCSDGLTSVIDEAQIVETVTQHSPSEAANILLQAALQQETRDNVSVAVFRVEA